VPAMSRIFLIIGGVINVLFVLFHIFLGYNIYQIQNIAVEYRSLMTMLNVGGVLFIALFAIASLGYTQEMLTTRIGSLVTLFVVLLYGSRALEEIVVSSHFSTVIFTACIIVAVVYIIPLVIGRKNVPQAN
jgi:hypothetical protein